MGEKIKDKGHDGDLWNLREVFPSGTETMSGSSVATAHGGEGPRCSGKTVGRVCVVHSEHKNLGSCYCFT